MTTPDNYPVIREQKWVTKEEAKEMFPDIPKFTLEFTKEEIEDLLMNLEQCVSEGYLNYGDPAFYAMAKLLEAIEKINEPN